MSKKAKGYDANAVAHFTAGRITYRELVAVLSRRVFIFGSRIFRTPGCWGVYLHKNRAANVQAGGDVEFAA